MVSPGNLAPAWGGGPPEGSNCGQRLRSNGAMGHCTGLHVATYHVRPYCNMAQQQGSRSGVVRSHTGLGVTMVSR
eukprot:7497752-Alexandrium_andersonii.AAC.1